MDPRILRRSMLASAISLACSAHVLAGDVTVATGTIETASKSVGGTDSVVVEAGGVWSVDDTVIKWKDPSTALVIDNAGLIESTEEGGRAINASGDGTGPHYLILNNAAGATIQSQSDAFRINTDFNDGQIVVNNAGTIHSTVDGQALDFDAVNSSGTSSASIVINNLAGGVIRADGADGIRPGEGGTVNNAGTIYSDGIIGDSNDGIDFQAHSGTVVNLPGGLISGQRHGITSSVNVDVYNSAGATILGRNGSGVGSDGTGKVINYGTITGAYVGTGAGDGDGVDIDYYGEVENWGVIQGTGAGGIDKTGRTNFSEGIAISGGGVVINHSSGTVSGVIAGVTGIGAATLNSDGSATYGKFSLINDGDIYGGYAGASLVGDVTVVNAGSISSGHFGIIVGPGSTAVVENAGSISGVTDAIQFAEGNDTLVIDPGSSITGLIDGGGGRDTLWLRGGSFDTAQNFEELYVSGAATLIGDNTFKDVLIDGSLQLGNGGATGSVGAATIVDNGSLSVNRSDNVTIANAISGTGAVRQVGNGVTTLTGANSYTGVTSVEAGTLVIGEAGTGSIVGDATVRAGATLRGTGKIGGAVTVLDGGVISPGSSTSPGTLSVTENVTLQSGASYEFESTGDRLLVGGRVTIGDNNVLLVEGASALKINTPYSIISATSIDGRFAETKLPDTNSLFLTPVVSYNSAGVSLVLDRNGVPLNSIALTHDQRTTADTLDSLDLANPLASSVLRLNAGDARTAIDELSGQQYASTRASLVEGAHFVRDAVTRHLLGTELSGGEGYAVDRDELTAWTSAWGHNDANSRGDASRLTSQGGGLLVGADAHLADSRLGVLLGRGRDQDDIESQQSSSRAWSTYLGVYGGTAWDAWRLRGGISYARQYIDTSRRLLLAGSAPSQLGSHYDANIAQAFAEGGFRFDLSTRQWLEPFIGVARVRLHADHASEGDGLGALDVAAGSTNVNVGSLGLHHEVTLGRSGALQAHATLAWNQSWGDLKSTSTQRFEGTALDFSVRGVPVARSSAALDAGLTFALSRRASLDASYTGQFASRARDQGARLQLDVQL